MSRGHNKGSGQHRKTGDWVTLARGRANVKRELVDRVRCPHGQPHWVSSRSLLGHLNTCQAGLARTTNRPG
jgi:hypothetical protein